MIGPVNKGNFAAIWAMGSYKAGLHSERTNVNNLLTRSEAQAMAHNVAGPIQRTTYEAAQVGPIETGKHRYDQAPDLSKQVYSSLAHAQMNYHAGDYLPQNYNALGQVSRQENIASAGLVINRVV